MFSRLLQLPPLESRLQQKFYYLSGATGLILLRFCRGFQANYIFRLLNRTLNSTSISQRTCGITQRSKLSTRHWRRFHRYARWSRVHFPPPLRETKCFTNKEIICGTGVTQPNWANLTKNYLNLFIFVKLFVSRSPPIVHTLFHEY